MQNAVYNANTKQCYPNRDLQMDLNFSLADLDPMFCFLEAISFILHIYANLSDMTLVNKKYLVAIKQQKQQL